MLDTKIITKNWGKIDPLKIEDYLKAGGFLALKKFIREMERQDIVAQVKRSGLLGRGGAGFLTGEKLGLVAANPEKEKYFICNLDESEPGTYKDRSIADNDPFLLIEGMAIMAIAAGIKKAFIYLNGNYHNQFQILSQALENARERNFLGQGIIGSCYDLEIEIFRGAGAYICGEETALLNSIEGKRGEPRMRPPYPTERGLFGKPTLINNAETVCSIPWIVLNGGEAYSKIGLEKCPGTKLYVLDGAVQKGGVYEAPTGITPRFLLENLGGGMQRGKEFWFCQVGGSSGNIVVGDELDGVMSLGKEAEISLGSGAVLVFDKTGDIQKFLLSVTGFFARESCGKCVPCREGTFRLWEIVKRFQDGEICERDEKALDDILWALENTTFCPLGKFSAVAMRDAMEKLKIFE